MEKPYNLEERTYLFAKDCRIYIKNLPKTISNIEDSKQLVRSSGSVAANYIEGNEKLGEKDLIFKIKISRKEAKESLLWIKLLEEMNPDEKNNIKIFETEAEEIRKILSAMIKKLER